MPLKRDLVIHLAVFFHSVLGIFKGEIPNKKSTTKKKFGFAVSCLGIHRMVESLRDFGRYGLIASVGLTTSSAIWNQHTTGYINWYQYNRKLNGYEKTTQLKLYAAKKIGDHLQLEKGEQFI